MISIKAAIRKEYKRKRAALSEDEKERRSGAIFTELLAWLGNWSSSKSVHLYFPIKRQGEVNTFPMLHWFWENDWRVFGSIIDEETGTMVSVRIPPNTHFFEDSWGIPIPQGVERASGEKFDLILVPLLAYDLEGWRIGFGKGYYDQFLSSLDFNPVKVGLSFFEPEEKLEHEPHDIPLDFCITPEKVIRF
ncbi:5-formyltetrahydrofolate cyclo-ligase [Algoriphagus limi]|uniref:5-formyltetrahydrofolate cyclo-ligase n=1 Tax=Algoriphagus limi TaxID=2975273 RepID=A0ABT2G629_9BACT|nr:5-formyltetrahydrofolate cyclo-ligase [Algoriphagus limi]MCS5490572.1 5-formyltetrahydrofolate cyclo-ligase [Algoriphagus limi]